MMATPPPMLNQWLLSLNISNPTMKLLREELSIAYVYLRSEVISVVSDEPNLRTTQQSSVIVWSTVLRLTHKRKLGQQAKRKYQPSDCLAGPRRQPPLSCRLLGYKGATSEGAELNQIFTKIETHLPSPIGQREFSSTLASSMGLASQSA
ncbi:hypothetical protein Tco_0819069 [Tanacetum coccineum]|uniref:Uncharacterized protein n=1 Tax=Tanacetum coccineum TaxID=301880 RepID=A0ABQ5A5H4_9ASTR